MLNFYVARSRLLKCGWIFWSRFIPEDLTRVGVFVSLLCDCRADYNWSPRASWDGGNGSAFFVDVRLWDVIWWKLLWLGGALELLRWFITLQLLLHRSFRRFFQFLHLLLFSNGFVCLNHQQSYLWFLRQLAKDFLILLFDVQGLPVELLCLLGVSDHLRLLFFELFILRSLLLQFSLNLFTTHDTRKSLIKGVALPFPLFSAELF